MTELELWPKPGPATRTLRHRTLARWRARLGGYFWLPCPLCGQMFGGHEEPPSSYYLSITTDGRHRLVCPAHDPVWPEGVAVP